VGTLLAGSASDKPELVRERRAAAVLTGLQNIGQGGKAKTFLKRGTKEEQERAVDSTRFIVLKRKEYIPPNKTCPTKRNRS
jgi:hypothetical protein